MRKYLIISVSIIVLAFVNNLFAATLTTQRFSQLSNDKVNVWETIVYPSSKQALKMHRHQYNRVIIALTDGVLKVTNDKGKVHYLKFKKDKAYYLKKDVPGELHTDENMGHQPIKVFVIELKN